MHGGRVMGGSVVQNIFHRAQQQGFVRLQGRLLSGRGQFQFHGAGTGGGAFVKLGGAAAQECPDRNSPAAQRLRAVLQFAGQVQITN